MRDVRNGSMGPPTCGKRVVGIPIGDERARSGVWAHCSVANGWWGPPFATNRQRGPPFGTNGPS